METWSYGTENEIKSHKGMKVIAVVRTDLFANAKDKDAWGDAGSLEKG